MSRRHIDTRRGSLTKLGALALGAALATTGCMKMDGDFTVHSGNAVDGTMRLGVSKQLAPMLGNELSPDNTFQNLPEGATATEWSNDSYKGVKVTFDNVPFKEFNGTGNGNELKLRHEDGRYILDGQLNLSNVAARACPTWVAATAAAVGARPAPSSASRCSAQLTCKCSSPSPGRYPRPTAR